MAERKRVTTGFDNDEVQSSQRNDRPERYKAKKGRTDRIRIMTDPERCYGANIKGPNSGFFAYSLADPADCAAALKGDEAAIARCEKVCPLWKRNYPIQERFAVLVYHIASGDSKGRNKSVKQAMPWVFAGDKFVALRDIAKGLPPHPKTGKPVPIQSIELIVNCDDDKFQKLRFMAVTSKGQKLTTYEECKEAVSDLFDDPTSLKSTCSLIEDCIAPEPSAQLIASIARAEKGEDAADDDDDFKPKAREEKPGKRSSKPDPEEGDADEADDFDVDADGDGEEPEADPEPEAKPVRIKPKGEAKPEAKPGKKPAAKPAKDDDVSEVDIDLDDIDG